MLPFSKLTWGLILLLSPTISLALYSKNDPIVALTPENFHSEVLATDHVVLTEFFAPWCGHCRNLAPHYKKAAEKLKGLVKVAAIDCDDDKNKPLCGQYGIQGFPTIKLFHGDRKKREAFPLDYQGPRTAKDIVDFAIGKIPNFSKRLDDLDKFLTEHEQLPRAILVHSKAATPALWKALSTEYKDRLATGEVKSSDKNLMNKLNVTDFPTVILYPKGESTPIVYNGQIKLALLADFFDGYVSTKKDSSQTSKKDIPKEEPFNPEIDEITSQSQLDALCLNKPGVCVISFLALESEYPESVKAHQESIDILKSLKKQYHEKKGPFHFVWINAIESGRQLMKDFDVSDMLPGVLALNNGKKVYQLFRSGFEETSLYNFLSDMKAGKGRSFSYTFEPKLNKEDKKRPVTKDEL